MKQLKDFIIHRIYSLNDQREWSLNQLANEADITQSTLSNIISGKAIPNVRTIEALCRAYKISLSRFFQGYNSKTFDIIVESDDLEILDYYRELPKKDKEIMLRVIKEFVSFYEEEHERKHNKSIEK